LGWNAEEQILYRGKRCGLAGFISAENNVEVWLVGRQIK
jgi:hypothetical protein